MSNGRLTPSAFDALRRIVRERTGIALGPGKEALVSSRVSKRLRVLGITDYDAYLEVLNDGNDAEITHLIDAIATNVTSFYRESDHFDTLRTVLQQWEAQGQRRFRIWSAACSTGEEPYSIAMTALDALTTTPMDLKILATDISTRALRQCVAGDYTAEKVAKIPPDTLRRFFERRQEKGTQLYRPGAALRETVVFRRLNLTQVDLPMRGPFDIVFCRNVMIYFDHETRVQLLEKISRLLRRGGLLFTGHTESLTGLGVALTSLRPSVFRKEG